METINQDRFVIHVRGRIPCSLSDPEGWAEYLAQKQRERDANPPPAPPMADLDRMQAWIFRILWGVAGCISAVAIAPVAAPISVVLIAASITWVVVCSYQLRGLFAD